MNPKIKEVLESYINKLFKNECGCSAAGMGFAIDSFPDPREKKKTKKKEILKK
jgi:hypothetical protein